MAQPSGQLCPVNFGSLVDLHLLRSKAVKCPLVRQFCQTTPLSSASTPPEPNKSSVCPGGGSKNSVWQVSGGFEPLEIRTRRLSPRPIPETHKEPSLGLTAIEYAPKLTR